MFRIELYFIVSEASTEHLETKKRMLALREKFGEDNWLSSHAGAFVQDIMGLHSVSQSASSPIMKIQTLADINVASSLHDSLIYIMDNEQSVDEPELQKTTECTENEDVSRNENEDVSLNENEDVSQNEKIPNEFPETYIVSPEIIYDPNEGDNSAKSILNF